MNMRKRIITLERRIIPENNDQVRQMEEMALMALRSMVKPRSERQERTPEDDEKIREVIHKLEERVKDEKC